MQPSSGGKLLFFPLEKVLLLPCRHLEERLLAELPSQEERSRWEQLLDAFHSTLAERYRSQTEQLKADWLLLNSSSPSQPLATSRREELEERFLQGLLEILVKANFHPIAGSWLREAEQEDFLYLLPLSIAWDNFDGAFLERFFQRHLEWQWLLREAPYSKRLLLFGRGLGLEQATGYFLLHKIDLWITDLLRTVGKAWVRFGLKAAHALAKAWRLDFPWAGADPAEGSVPPVPVRLADRPTEGMLAFKRVPLRDAGTGIRHWFRRSTVQEPTLKEVVLLYRLQNAPGCRPDPSTDPEPLQVRAYRDIPLADLEVVIPARRVSYQVIDILKMVMTGAMGALVAFGRLLYAAALNPMLLLVALSSLVGYGARVLVQCWASRSRYIFLLTDALYSKHRDKDIGVLLYLADSVVEQERKEVMLAYFLLCRRGPMTVPELEVACEEFLGSQLGLRADFETDDAVRKLEELKLVRWEQDRLVAVSLAEAEGLLAKERPVAASR